MDNPDHIYSPPNIFRNQEQATNVSLQPDTKLYSPDSDDDMYISDSELQPIDSQVNDNGMDVDASNVAPASNVTDDSIANSANLKDNQGHRVDEEPQGSGSAPANLDLLSSVRGMYRILDLISEQGSGGLVDKVIIDQDSLKEFINEISPGAYVSLTRVSFKALDDFNVKPIGVYGSKEQIVMLLLNIGAVDNNTAGILRSAKDDSSGPRLRSGLYIVRSLSAASPHEQLFVIYWPEDNTWDDDAVSSVRRNRVTFMRYLTKIADQIVSLISSEHAQSMVWTEESEDYTMDIDPDQSDRLFTFEVAKTNEQEEDVKARPGFKMMSQMLTVNEPPSGCAVDTVQLQPKLLAGEAAQAFMTTRYIAPSIKIHEMNRELHNPVQLQTLISNGSLKLNEKLDHDAITALVENGLRRRYPESCQAWKTRDADQQKEVEAAKEAKSREMTKNLEQALPKLTGALRNALIEQVIDIFPTLLRGKLGYLAHTDNDQSDAFAQLTAMYPAVQEEFDRLLKTANLQRILDKDLQKQKERLLTVDFLLQKREDLDQSEREELIKLTLDDDDMKGVSNVIKESAKDSKSTPKSKMWIIPAAVTDLFLKKNDSTKELLDSATQFARSTTDSKFISLVDEIVAREPGLQQDVSDIVESVYDHLRIAIDKLVNKVRARADHIQRQECSTQLQRETESRDGDNKRRSRLQFIRDINQAQVEASTILEVTSLVAEKSYGYQTKPQGYRLSGSLQSRLDPGLEYKINVLELKADHRQSLELDPTFLPIPHVETRFSHTFRLPTDYLVLHAQLLEKGRILVIIDNRRGDLAIYLENLAAIHGAVEHHKPRKTLKRDKIGTDFLLAFDESKRMLSVCASTKLQLHLFLFDEAFTSLQAVGSAVNLTQWYSEGISICHSCFVCGSEEILLVDTGGRARVFSLITQQFRPATLQLQQVPSGAYSSPDGACLILSFIGDMDALSLRAYHWTTFGSTEGIPITGIDLPAGPLVLTSFGSRASVHLIGLDLQSHQCQSFALDIASKITEFMFKEKGVKDSPTEKHAATFHNCLVDCHADVWTRFPVVSAIQRRTIVSSADRLGKSILFVTDRDYDKFAPHFADLILSFDRRTRKPNGEELKGIRISAVSFEDFLAEVAEIGTHTSWHVSCFRIGEWLVDILCLIPIHIAITRENRFIPLKDGVTSAELEKTLLGAEVSRIVDSLSLGWYESIFQSYMASKPVKVVSSMGEQSVGKSFALNHLVDTSFAGSAMRTTEGVWMSVTPTEEALIVALDFEGVHSIERSAQEDTLLVLFNTAISNLVLFRNNFALSRDITGLFQSFQSSSTVLDPAANPTLFQSTLVIIIKDVVDSDKKEIVREFSLKFRKIVQDEQDANFISRLHAGKLDIIPWPVIESKQFYALFPALKKRLDQQVVTHPAAGEFLHTLKTLMAKLKANDWGALSQTLAAHRAQRLLTMLPIALATGLSESEHSQEHLKNFDTDTIIDMPDTPSLFFLSSPSPGLPQASIERTLLTLRNTFSHIDQRQEKTDIEWTSELSSYLDSLADMRIDHVREWITSNLSRFKAGHANIDALRRTFDGAIVELKSNVQLCKMQCASCHLLCLRSRFHNPGESHDCQTSHQCKQFCDFGDEHEDEAKLCGYPAGHSGKHICVVDVHLCGQNCDLKDKKGCSGECTKVAGHPEENHMCSARIHACGEPCQLVNLSLPGGKFYSCPETCGLSSLDDHIDHVCDNRMCPVQCQLCKRLCANPDHLHGLTEDAVHLCGQEHSCSAVCQADGICEIDTAPQSIEATFTGRHETFQYTKYSQVAKRLPCVIPIRVGRTEHSGHHSHSTDETPFHYCETRCENCGYYCTLPRGHSQKEHDTHHGSMSKTRWAVDGPDGTVLDLNGRRFAADDDGAPMLCNLFCQEMGRHVHIDYCRTDAGERCGAAQVQHSTTRLTPNSDRAKDWITHSLYWSRSGFKDPYSRDDQAQFAKCDAMCPGPEHAGTATNQPQPSYCTLPIFHPPTAPNQAAGMGYVSHDGHLFPCKNPAVMQQAFHVLFVIDRSGSMAITDRRPLGNSPSTAPISRRHNNRLGAVYSSLHAFWVSRQAALDAATQRAGGAALRRDAYSVILFDSYITNCITNDFTSSPDDLLNAVLPHGGRGGTNFTSALASAQAVMEQNWSTERTPVVIFLSDGECGVADQTVQTLCRSAVHLGKPLSFHAVAFGPSSGILRRMAQIALEVQNSAPRDPLLPATAVVESSYAEALDTVRLAETFLGIAESLRKPRGSLLR